jgi:mRNA interferase YafQ
VFALVATEHFRRRTRKFLRAHPDLRDRLGDTLDALAHDPLQQNLRLHPLHGPLSGLHAIRLTHVYRMIIRIVPAAHEIELLDIGSHDDVY